MKLGIGRGSAMLITIRKNNMLVKGFSKEGRCNYAMLEDGSKIQSSKLGSISIECSECSKQSHIQWRTALLSKPYSCQSCVKAGERNGFFGKSHTEETKKAHSDFMCGRYTGEDNAFYGKTHTKEAREKIRSAQTWQKGSSNPFYGKTHSSDTIEKIIEGNKAYRESLTEEQRAKTSKKLSRTQKDFQKSNPKYYREIKQRGAYASAKSHKKYKMNKLEEKVYQVLQDHFTDMFKYTVILGHLQFDFGCKSKRILIEVQGDYWHGNPAIYGEGKRPLNNIQINKQAKDKVKQSWCDDHDFTLLTFWESDINADPNIILRGVLDVI